MAIRLSSPLVETSWLQENLHEQNLRILDCSVLMQHFDDGTFAFVSGKSAWQESHIPGSIFVDVHTQLSDPTHELALMMPAPHELAETMMQLGVGDDSLVVLYDSTNHAWATRVWWMLRACGFDNAGVLNGGWSKWQAEGLEVSDKSSEYTPVENFTVHARPELMVNKARVLESIGAEKTTLIHSLPAATFTGEVVPYGRPGRISGSKNLYCESLINNDTKAYIDLESMRNKFAETGALSADKVITYCGGGVAASSNAFALTLLGIDDVAIYDGSLSEWTLDPDLPMETG